LIFALDVGGDAGEALKWVDLLKDHVGMFKIGKEAFTSFGPQLVREVVTRGGDVFLDLKFHDIPNTVARAAEGALRLNVSMFNIHALGGARMMEDTVKAVEVLSKQLGRPMPMVLAVTVLTSLDDGDVERLGFHVSASELAVHLARLARDAGMTGVVASAREVGPIRDACGDDFVIVTPGIRLAAPAEGDDQKRVLTPREALRMGADYIVVGRPIRMADDPVAAARMISEEIAEGIALKTPS